MVTDEMVKRAATEYLSHRGERPYRVTRRGAELWEDHAPAMRAALEAALSAAEPVKVRNDDVGFVDFLNADRPYICRKTEGTCYLLIDRETGDVVGYRKYDDEAIDTPAPSVAVKALADAYKAGFDASSQGYNGEVFPEYEADNEWLAQRDSDLSALSAQVQDVAGAVEAFERDYPELYWHIAKGKITAGEPLYGAIITDIRGNELGHGESDVSAADAFNIAVSVSNLPAALAKQGG